MCVHMKFHAHMYEILYPELQFSQTIEVHMCKQKTCKLPLVSKGQVMGGSGRGVKGLCTHPLPQPPAPPPSTCPHPLNGLKQLKSPEFSLVNHTCVCTWNFMHICVKSCILNYNFPKLSKYTCANKKHASSHWWARSSILSPTAILEICDQILVLEKKVYIFMISGQVPSKWAIACQN